MLTSPDCRRNDFSAALNPLGVCLARRQRGEALDLAALLGLPDERCRQQRQQCHNLLTLVILMSHLLGSLVFYSLGHGHAQ